MIVGGINAHFDVEVISLDGSGLTCAKPSNHPAHYGQNGVFFDGSPTVCGGPTGQALWINCYKYNVKVIICKKWLESVTKR